MTRRISFPILLQLTIVLLCCFCGPVLAGEIKSSFSPGWIWAGRILNVAILLGGLAFLLRKPIKSFLNARTEEIQKKLAEAETELQEAREKLHLMEERLGHLDEELAAMRQQAQADAEAEQQRILQRARDEADRIRARGGQEIENLKKTAMLEIRQFVSEQAGVLAEELIRKELTPAVESHLVDRFMAKLGENR